MSGSLRRNANGPRARRGLGRCRCAAEWAIHHRTRRRQHTLPRRRPLHPRAHHNLGRSRPTSTSPSAIPTSRRPPLAVHRGARRRRHQNRPRGRRSLAARRAHPHASSLYSITATLTHRRLADKTHRRRLPLPVLARALARAAARLGGAAVHGRLPGRPSSPVELSAGVVLDHGFVAARGGASAALAAAGAAFALTNALFEDQLGVRLRVQTVVVHDGAVGRRRAERRADGWLGHAELRALRRPQRQRPRRDGGARRRERRARRAERVGGLGGGADPRRVAPAHRLLPAARPRRPRDGLPSARRRRARSRTSTRARRPPTAPPAATSPACASRAAATAPT